LGAFQFLCVRLSGQILEKRRNDVNKTLKRSLIFVLSLALVEAVLPVRADDGDDEHGRGQKSDFALLDQEPTVADVSVQCAASNGTKPQAFTMHVTMTNRADLGGTDGFVRVTYHDTDFVDYAIQKNTTVQISLAGGGTPGVDDVIKVTSTGGALLIGQASLITGGNAKPHPLLGGTSFCTTTAAGGTSPI
jgi:hypothetical protein